MSSIIHDTLFGLAIGDALGVPVEFKYRSELAENPVTGIRGYGTYNQPPGTWSDDSSLTFCLADSLCSGYNLTDIAFKFVAWRKAEIWTPHGEVFDIGMTTHRSIGILEEILRKGDAQALHLLSLEGDEYSNGNGSLMRILPLYFVIKDSPLTEQFETIWAVSALTHPHVRSALACFFYLRIYHYLVNKSQPLAAVENARSDFRKLLELQDIVPAERAEFSRVLNTRFHRLPAEEIASDGYVINSLEASVWCFLRSQSYEQAILTAINLGEDTDTTAAIVGGLAGVYYGLEAIPQAWREALVKTDEIWELCNAFSQSSLME